jgi:hypothetical protein
VTIASALRESRRIATTASTILTLFEAHPLVADPNVSFDELRSGPQELVG